MEPNIDPLYWYVGEGSSSSSSQERQLQLQGCQSFAKLPTRLDNSDWPQLLPATGPMCTAPLSSPLTDNNPGVAENQTYIDVKTSTPTQAIHRSRKFASAKSEVRKLSGGTEAPKLEVVFQKLNDAKKGIPDDGHRGWKKYGNKSIQNSNHCRGYYKCSVKECRAKKMVQPTDKDPSLFEVTYVGKHTCSSVAGRRRSRSARTTSSTVLPVEPGESHQGPSDDDWKSANHVGGMELQVEEGASILTGSIKESISGWTDSSTCIEIKQPGSWPSGNIVKTHLDDVSCSYLGHTMTTSTTTSTACDEDQRAQAQAGDASMDTYLHQSLRHHQAVYNSSFQEPLLWHDFDMDSNLSTGLKSVSMDSESP